MTQYIRKVFAGLVLLVTAVSPIFAMGPTHTISAHYITDQFAEFKYAGDPFIPVGMFLWGAGRIRGIGDAGVEIFTDNPSIGVSGGPFTGALQIQRFGGRGRPSEFLYGVIADGNAFSNGFQVNYFAAVTVTGGTGRYEGATGIINVSVYQYGILDPAQHPGNFGNRIRAELILDGQYSVP